jgi:hypothetical protein
MTSGSSDWMEQVRRLMESLRSPAGEAAGPGDSDCRWCPLCQAAAIVRGERPEVSAALADILTATAAALRQFAGEQGDAAPEPAPAPADERPAVQRIDLA